MRAVHLMDPAVDVGHWGADGGTLEEAVGAEEPQDLRAFEGLSSDVWLTGRARHTASYGVWVDVAPPEAGRGPPAVGLLHLTELADAHGAKEARVSAGTELRVRVVHVDRERGHLGLSARGGGVGSPGPLSPELAASTFGGIFACEWLPGSVVSVEEGGTCGGVLVDVAPPGGGPPGRGLCPAGLIGGASRGPDLSRQFRPGQEVHVRVVGVGPAAGGSSGLRLSMLGGAGAIRADLEAQLHALERGRDGLQEPAVAAAAPPPPAVDRGAVAPADTAPDFAGQPLPDQQDLSSLVGTPGRQVLAGVVHHVASYGVYVTVVLPSGRAVWGLAHSAASGGGGAGPFHLSPGDRVRVRIAHLDVERGRLALSLEGVPDASGVRDTATSPPAPKGEDPSSEARRSALGSLDATTWVAGVVQRVLSYGLLVDVSLPDGGGPARPLGRGLVYLTELEPFSDRPGEAYAAGQQIRVRVLDGAPDADGLLPLSMSARPEDIQADLKHQHGLARAAGRPPEVVAQPEAAAAAAEGKRAEGLAAFLDVPPSRLLLGTVRCPTPFGLLISVEHPDGAGEAQGLLPGEPPGGEDWSPGRQVQVRVDSVDSHRGVLGLSI